MCFDWSLGRGAEGAKAIAKDFEGWLQSDGYKVYDTVCADRPIQQVGCWAHTRRKFYEAWRDGELEAIRYLLLIRKLYKVETETPDFDRAEERAAWRREKSLPILDELKELLAAEKDKFWAKSGLSVSVR